VNLANTSHRPTIIGVGGFTSEVGKTTLMCDLLRASPGWEAIKTTRGHYRSCGKDPQACCVSHLLEDAPVIRSGRELTYAPGKDTGRYWDAGAANVHWLIATDVQVASGIEQAIGRVKADGVFVEGNSFSQYVVPNFFIMVARSDNLKIKNTARCALNGVSAFYLSGETEPDAKERLKAFLAESDLRKTSGPGGDVPVFTRREFPQLLKHLRVLNSSILASAVEQTHVGNGASQASLKVGR
jgi:molybdopterin-guanine dinucleotide biosynthesis protein